MEDFEGCKRALRYESYQEIEDLTRKTGKRVKIYPQYSGLLNYLHQVYPSAVVGLAGKKINLYRLEGGPQEVKGNQDSPLKFQVGPQT